MWKIYFLRRHTQQQTIESKKMKSNKKNYQQQTFNSKSFFALEFYVRSVRKIKRKGARLFILFLFAHIFSSRFTSSSGKKEHKNLEMKIN